MLSQNVGEPELNKPDSYQRMNLYQTSNIYEPSSMIEAPRKRLICQFDECNKTFTDQGSLK